MPNSFFNNSDIIYSYTRANALADGVLVDCTEAARKVGFSVPLAISEAAYLTLDPEGEEFAANLALLVSTARNELPRHENTPRFRFQIPSLSKKEFILDIGPGDSGEPVLTLGFNTDF